MKNIVILFLLVFVLFGCSYNKITYGEVYEKNHNEEYTETRFMTSCISNGKSVSCFPIPYLIHHEENWEIKIKSYNKKENKYEKATYYVDKKVYNNIKVGDMFKYDENNMLDEEPITKERKSNE